MILPHRALTAPLLALALATLAAFVAATPLRADPSEVYAPGGVAISGYDPVAYFVEGEAVMGRADLVLKWRGAMWYFASPEAMEAFEMNPNGYAPQYGGHCAYAATQGAAAAADPTVFTLHAGRLYLNASPGQRAAWARNIAQNIARADAAWPSLFGR